jgi:hypothetical protein
MTDDQRTAFAEFLRRLATGTAEAIEWERFVVTHYHDELLEDIRRRTAKLSIDRDGSKEWSDSEVAALQHWYRQLRGEQH